ncbi:hypothetical protein D3C72_2175110 [compost metagenome]
MLGGALVDDDLAHLAVVEHMADVVVLRAQGLGAQVQLGIHLDGLGRGFLVGKNAQVGVEPQTGQGQGLVTHNSWGHDG